MKRPKAILIFNDYENLLGKGHWIVNNRFYE